ncbi:MAG TPA: vWA domain-containing protein [Gaiellaceae bacterium]|nr:vWA domain-containing protein [Gaiellaceae bacterium]
MSAIELADYPALARAAGRTRVLRLLAAAAALGLAAIALLVAPSGSSPSAVLLPHGATGIVVIDVSASISTDTYARIASTLDRLRRGGGSAGLILFSDTAYQALPPGTPVAELGAFERFFQVSTQTQPGILPEPPQSPWTDQFSAGTRISTGLSLALAVLQEEHLRKPVVLLVSDLNDDAGDLESLTSVALAYRHIGVPIRVVGLNPSPDDASFMQRLLPQGGGIVSATLPGEKAGASKTGLPVTFILVAIALALVASAYLAVTERLRWRNA